MNENVYPLDRAINTFKVLEKRKPPKRQNYVIYAYILLQTPINGLHGFQIYLGSYEEEEDAYKEVENIIKDTGHKSLYVCKSCELSPIDENFRPNRCFFIDPSKDDMLNKAYREKIEKEIENEKKRSEIAIELEEEQNKEQNNDTIEHYMRNWYFLISNYYKLTQHNEQIEHLKKMYEMRQNMIREQYIRQPHFEKEWLEVYENRLLNRGEKYIFEMIKDGHDKLFDGVLGDLINSN